ncbi:MAG TPA: hypothetical protein VIJ84_09135, partial [Gaiellaceae bacterium]
MTSRTELLGVSGLPPQAGAGEIELTYLERHAEAEKRLREGDKRARFEIERFDGVFRKPDGAEAEEEIGTAPPAGASLVTMPRRSVIPLSLPLRCVHYATGYGCPEAKNIEDQARQAPHPSGARSAAP